MSITFPTQSVDVYLNHYGTRLFCGRIASVQGKILFEYAPSFLKTNIQISPFKVPLQAGQFYDDKRLFDGIMGVFDDSLPDGWGRLLLDREFQKRSPANNRFLRTGALERLTMVGTHGMGALEYEPSASDTNVTWPECQHEHQLDIFADQSLALLQDKDIPLSDISLLRTLNGSSGGARPKILVQITQNADGAECFSLHHGEPWLIKFKTHEESKEAGLDEYVYSLLAQKAGIRMPPTRLFNSQNCAGFFGVQRFDRQDDKKIHVHSACGLLHANFRLPSLSYEGLLRLCMVLTRDVQEVEELFRRMVFNVAIQNYDDHTKNFSFSMQKDFSWKLSPAYDITKSTNCFEHAASVNAKGRDITQGDMLTAANVSGIPEKKAIRIIEEVYDTLSGFDALKRNFL